MRARGEPAARAGSRRTRHERGGEVGVGVGDPQLRAVADREPWQASGVATAGAPAAIASSSLFLIPVPLSIGHA